MLPRQARLRPSFSEWYPRITPGEWHHAMWVREITLAHHRGGEPRWRPTGRVLSDEHFEFQGGSDRPGFRGVERRLLAPERP